MNKKKKYLYVIIGILLALASAAVPVWKTVKYMRQQKEDISIEKEEETEPKFQEETKDTPEEKLKHSLVMVLQSEDGIWQNQELKSEGIPFMENGILYLPVSVLAQQKQAVLVKSDQVWYLQHQGNITAMMEAYNIYLENQEPVKMKGCPVEKQGILYVSAEDLGNIFSMKVQMNENRGIAVLGAEQLLEEGDWEALGRQMDAESIRKTDDLWMKEWEEETGLSKGEIHQLAKKGVLYQSDPQGKLFQCICTDEGIFQEIPCPDTGREYPAEKRFIDGAAGKEITKEIYVSGEALKSGTLYEWKEESWTPLGLIPEEEKERKIMDELGAYMQEKASADTGTDNIRTFEHLIQKAEPGDFLVFKARGADAEYGYFNHAALILRVDLEKMQIHVLHARSAELGVGAEEDMDTFGEADFTENSYWNRYDLVYLCAPRQDISGLRKTLTEEAYEKFQGYAFGYGSWLGKEETNCAELIEDAYEMAGVPLLDETSPSSRLKEVLSGNARNMVVVPDDLVLSEKSEVKAVWEKETE